MLNPDKLYPMLGSTPGVGLKSVTAAALLLFAAAFVRACLRPFTAWQTGTVEAPPAALALVAGVWPVMAGALLLRALPVLGATWALVFVVAPLLWYLACNRALWGRWGAPKIWVRIESFPA